MELPYGKYLNDFWVGQVIMVGQYPNQKRYVVASHLWEEQLVVLRYEPYTPYKRKDRT